tara:strand:- start:530 stop:1843 length:1314 start_codon:yes stop_codon:yes gene_type:complete
MKKKYIGSLVVVLSSMLFFLMSCDTITKNNEHVHGDEESSYTCPMHPQIIKDHPDKCPICSMDLVAKKASHELSVDSSFSNTIAPVNAQVISNIPLVTADSGLYIKIFKAYGVVTYDTRKQVKLASKIGGRVEKLMIKYNYQQVAKGDLVMEIYSPDLASAQRELLLLKEDSENLVLFQKAKQRLQLLGMTLGQVDEIIRTGKVLYKVPVYSPVSGYVLEKSVSPPQVSAMASSSTVAGNEMDQMGGPGASISIRPSSEPVSAIMLREGQYVRAGESMFTIYQSDAIIAEFAIPTAIAPYIKLEQKLLFHPVSNKSRMLHGKIGLKEPVFRGGENFMLIRVYKTDKNLIPGQLLNAHIPITFKNDLWLDKSSVWQIGSTSVVFRHNGEVLVPHEIKTGAIMDGKVQILTNIQGWEVATNASYLIDSESFVKFKNNIN